ncbi:lantibiotic dehydratase [Streptomyces sp. NPDC058239]|uniref:lantibiotic dehydratase n=1 Tax=Streptomyces sp. NPDC058239 TaxID=3346395 RepID=UPI0036EF1EB6
MTTSNPTPYYRPLPAAVLRASVHGVEVSLPSWPDDADGELWRTWLAQVWAMRPLSEAVALASPVLADQIETMLSGRQTDAGQARRMVRALARYLLRMRGRATPFGAFAGVAATSFGPHISLQWNEDHQVRTRADAVWLANITARLEASPALLRRLPVVVNDLAVERGDRLVVPWQPHQAAASHGSQEAVEISVRLIPVVRTVQRAAHLPLRAEELVDKIAADHPGPVREALESLVGQLVASGVLITSLRAPSTVVDALAHLLDQLRAADADKLPELKPLIGDLSAVQAQLKAPGRVSTWASERDRRGLIARMRGLSSAVDQPLAVDLRLGGTLVLPRVVADEAAAAAEALIRLSPIPTMSESWREYHRSFLSRYGPGTLVPVAELADPVAGLGFPRHFTRPTSDTRAVTARDEALLALAQQAALDGSDEIVLDAAALDRIAPETTKAKRPVSPVDLWADIRAMTPEEIAEGSFTLGVCGFGRLAANTGRFLPLLDEPDRQQMTTLYAGQQTGVEGALAAQLSFPPRHLRAENVLRVPPVLPQVISLAEHRAAADGHLSVADLAVAADSTRLYVISRSRRQVVEAMLSHAGARHIMPPLARLLFEVPRSIHPAVTSFDWGTASCLPYLPRVRYGRSVLAPARWRLDPADLPGPETSMAAWSSALEAVREKRRLPVGLAVGGGDRHLRLDLGEALDRSVLRAHLDEADGPVTVAEAPTTPDHRWCDGRAHEVVIPLAATAPPGPAPVFLTGSAPLPVTDRKHGAKVVFVKLYAQLEAFDTLLTAHLPALLQRWTTPPRWWFARYLHPVPHLRLRLHDADHEHAAGLMAAWAAELRQCGLLGEIAFDAYQPETGRYGTGAAMAAAEELFAADSTAVLAQLAFLSVNRDLHPQALTATSLVDLAGAMTGSRSAGLHWLTAHPEYAAGTGKQDRNVRQQTFHLADGERITGLPGGAALTDAWAARTKAAASYTARLDPETTRLTPETVLGSLLHLHHVRALGIDSEAEAVTYKLARAVALAHTRRTDKKGKDR